MEIIPVESRKGDGVLKTTRQFYVIAGGILATLGFALAFLLVSGDKAGQPLAADLRYLAEGPAGLPQIELSFQGKAQPAQAAVEAAFTLDPATPGDFSWKDTTLIFMPAAPLRSDTAYRVRLRGGLKLQDGGRSDYRALEWTFQTRPNRVAFLKREGTAVNLWLQAVAGGRETARPLTFETNRQVMDFTISPGGERIVYSLAEPDGSEASLWLVKTNPSPGEPPRQLLYERGIRATEPQWSPGGDIIAYERRLVLNGGDLSPSQLWLIQPDGTSLAPLYSGADRVGTTLTWAAGGSKAFFWEPDRQSLGIFNFTGEPVWQPLPGVIPQDFTVSPDGKKVVLTRYDYSGASQRQLLIYLTQAGSKDQPSKESQVANLPVAPPDGYSDYFPEWSPDGKYVAFLRQNSAAGPQKESRLWLFEVETGRNWPLDLGEAALPGTTLGAYQWAPDSRKILFEVYPTGWKTGNKPTNIWEITLNGGTCSLIAENVFSGKWVN